MNLNTIVSQFFTQCERDFDRTILVRADGIVVYSSKDIIQEAASIGALVGGVWQAAEALNKQISPEKDIKEYRFSFDQSDSGLYIVPVALDERVYYMSTLYRETFNPALLKRNFRVLKNELEKYLKDNFNQSQTEESIVSRDKFLFRNITDEEIDNLFAF
jgi:hypothetical protein